MTVNDNTKQHEILIQQQQQQQQQLTFTDYDDLQSRLVLLPHDEDDEGTGAVISMYYGTNTGSFGTTGSRLDVNQSCDATDLSNTSFVLDTSVTGYILTHISSSSNDEVTTASNACDTAKLIEEEFASILSTIRNHATPIVLTFTSSLPDIAASNDDIVDDENSTSETSVHLKKIATVSQSHSESDTASEHLVEGVVATFEEEKKSEDGATHQSCNDNVTDDIPPPPPTTPIDRIENVAASSLSPSIFTTKNLSSWTSRMSAVAVTKATALAKAANEHAKVTSALVAAAVVPEFPNNTITIINDKKFNNYQNDTITSPPVVATAVADDAATTTTIGNDAQQSACSTHNSNDQDLQTSQTPPTDTTTLTTEEEATVTTDKCQTDSIKVHFPDLHIYVQSETGAFVPVPEICDTKEHNMTVLVSPSKANQPSVITNSSYVMVRLNVQQPAPTNEKYQYQWYRSRERNDWVKLPRATGPTLQPSATEIGYRLRCVISAININNNTTDESSGDTLICETADIVTASLPILNGSRQALARGAQFGGLLGLGKAEGRTFRVKIVLSSSPSVSSSSSDRRKILGDNTSSSHSTTSCHLTIAAVTIYQVAGTTAEPIHPENEPLFCRAATVWDYNHIKNIALIFQSNDISPSASMVAALCSNDNDGEVDDDSDNDIHMDYDRQSNHRLYFRLQAPNRLARESMLLSIGIANFQGKPSELNASSVLFSHHPFNNECSGSASSSLGDDSIVSHSSSIAWQSSATPEKITVQRRSSSLGGGTTDDGMKSDLEEELDALRNKLTRKDKVISELQRQVTHSDEAQRLTESNLHSVQEELDGNQKELFSLRKSLGAADVQIEKVNNEIQKISTEYDTKIGALECDIQVNNDRIVSLERQNRTLQNDKDVLKAAVESRDFKLTKMEELQMSLDDARVKLTQRNNLQFELDEANKRYKDTLREVERLQISNSEHDEERNKANERIAALQQALHVETTKTSSHQSKLEMEQMKIQKLKAERNSYKQKGDSLAKEMSRICRDGRTIRDIEKIVADDATRREEVNVLRDQKRKALEEVEHFRTAYEQSLSIQHLAGLNHDAGKLLERNAELERLLSELTEYLNAKEMQLETMKQVNDTLQSEIRDLAKASMSNNDI